MVVVDAVAAGVNIRVGGLETAVDDNAAPGGDQQARLAGQFGYGSRHHGDDQVGREEVPAGHDLQGMIVADVGPDFPDGLIQVEGDALIPEMLGDHAGQAGFQGGRGGFGG